MVNRNLWLSLLNSWGLRWQGCRSSKAPKPAKSFALFLHTEKDLSKDWLHPDPMFTYTKQLLQQYRMEDRFSGPGCLIPKRPFFKAILFLGSHAHAACHFIYGDFGLAGFVRVWLKEPASPKSGFWAWKHLEVFPKECTLCGWVGGFSTTPLVWDLCLSPWGECCRQNPGQHSSPTRNSWNA